MIDSPAVPVARREEAEERSLERRRSQHEWGTEQKGMKEGEKVEEEDEVWEERKDK